MKRFTSVSGSELIFISKIKKDGSGVIEVNPEDQEWLKREKDYSLCRLSISEKTYIAFNMSAFVVKLKSDN